jgi:phage-related protein
MKNVSFDGIPASNWGLYLSAPNIEKPTPKTVYIDIPFGDGALDLSESSGEVRYNDRKVGMSLQGVMTSAQLETLATTVANTLLGKKVKIKFDNDPNYYYWGRVSNVAYQKAGGIGEIVVEAICDPYKYKNAVTEQVEVVTTTKAVTLMNVRKTAYPKITTTAAFSIIKDGVTYSYGIVTDFQTTIPLYAGSNALTVNGTGTITFDWQEGAL